MNKTTISRRNWLKIASSATAGLAVSAVPLFAAGCNAKQENSNKSQKTEENSGIKYFSRKKRIPCVDCSYCMPCQFGLDIPGIFRFINMHTEESETAGDDLSARGDHFDEKSLRASYDDAIPDLRQADKCTGCKSCVPKCPEMIDIPAEMLKIAKITFR